MSHDPDKRATDAALPNEGRAQRAGGRVAGRRLQETERSFAPGESPAKPKARQAPDGPQARQADADRRPSADGQDPQVDETLDRGLEETFPASDPMSASPGAD